MHVQPQSSWALALALAPAVHAVRIDGDLVFLDVAGDRYVCLPKANAQHVAIGERDVQVADPALAEELCAGGLLGFGADPPLIAAVEPPARPTQSAVPWSVDQAQWGDAAALTRATLDLARHYRARPFAQIIKTARARPPCGPPRGRARDRETTLEAVVSDFHRWVPYAPVSGKCLLRSFMLLRLLQRHGLDAVWVFGVATWPFQGHCWLQSGDTVLDDTVERLAPFHPILAI